jgi:hypothetical protein
MVAPGILITTLADRTACMMIACITACSSARLPHLRIWWCRTGLGRRCGSKCCYTPDRLSRTGWCRLHMQELSSLSLRWIPSCLCQNLPMTARILQAAPHLCKVALYGQPPLCMHMDTLTCRVTDTRALHTDPFRQGRLDARTLRLLKPLKQLTELAFVGCECIDVAGLSQLPQLQKLSLDDCNITNARQVADAVARLPSLHCLSLQRNVLRMADSRWLVQLAAIPQLTRVVLLQSAGLSKGDVTRRVRRPNAGKFVCDEELCVDDLDGFVHWW